MYANRLRLFLALSIVIGAVPVYAKHQPKVQDCQIRFAVLMYDINHPEQADQYRWGQLTDRQRNWWGKKGQQKFPSVCMADNASQAEYVIAWSLRAVRHRGLLHSALSAYLGVRTCVLSARVGPWPSHLL